MNLGQPASLCSKSKMLKLSSFEHENSKFLLFTFSTLQSVIRVRLACIMNFGFFGSSTGRFRIYPDSSPTRIVELIGDIE